MSNSKATSFLQFLGARFNRRSVAFLACLVLATLFWLLTSLSKEYVHEVNVPVKYEGLPETMLIVNDPAAEVSAEVKGFGFDLLWHWLKFENLQIPVIADPAILPSINRKGEEVHYILTDVKGNGMVSMKNEQLEILDISPDTLFIMFKPRFIKEVPVKLNADVSFLKQYGSVTAPVIEPDSVLLIGVREDIDSISYVLTERQEWKEVSTGIVAQVPLMAFPQLPFVKVSPTIVQVEIEVVEFTEGKLTIPLTVVADRPNTVQIFPQEVEIIYQVPLSSYDQIQAAQFEASVVLNEGVNAGNRLVVSVNRQPDMVKQVRVSPSQVEYIIQK